jgi:hypothetical protein
MTQIQQAAKRLIAKHGGTRKAGKATGINYAYLSRLSTGEKCNPKDDVLKALGLRLKREYVRK